MKWVGVILFIVCLTLTVQAQDTDDCPVYVEEALNAVSTLCTGLERNQLCYGNLTLEAEAQPDVTNLQLEAPGDIARVQDIQSLRLMPMDTEVPEWGIALMKLQANLPDTLPGQNVTVLLFGDTQVQALPPLPEVSITVSSSQNINVRQRPSTNAAIVTTLEPDTPVTADGRTESGDWLRVLLPSGDAGWAAAYLFSTDDDILTLNVVEADAFAYRPLQAFYFQSAPGDSACTQAPDSGMLIQTPQGATSIRLQINEVLIELGSTIYIQAQASDAMRVFVVEGQITVTAQDVTRTVPAGMFVSIPLDADSAASDVPSEPEAYDPAGVAALPVALMPELITIAEPRTEPIITPTPVQQSSSAAPISGNVVVDIGFPSGCQPSEVLAGTVVIIRYDMGYDTEAAANAGLADAFGVTANGQGVPLINRVIVSYGSGSGPAYGIRSTFDWGIPAAGVYELVAVDRGEIRSCTFTVR